MFSRSRLSSILLVPTFALMLTAAHCHKPSPVEPDPPEACVAAQETTHAAFPTYASNGQAVAEFRLTHVLTSYTPNGCQASTGQNTLVITSMAAVPVAFSYTLYKLRVDNTVSWSYNGNVTRLAPGQSIDQGVVSNALGRANAGSWRVVFNSLSQVP